MFDIRGKAEDPREARLSNFTARRFVFDNVLCAGLEGPIQAFKCPDFATQISMCALSGKEAKKAGSVLAWKSAGVLWWQNQEYNRFGSEYFNLITRLYDAAYDQDPSFKQDLLALGHADIRHSIGNPDMRETVLTEVEMIYQLNRLRICALRGRR